MTTTPAHFTPADIAAAASAALRRSDLADRREGMFASSTSHVAARIAHGGDIPHPRFFDDAIVARADRLEAFATWRELREWAEAVA